MCEGGVVLISPVCKAAQGDGIRAGCEGGGGGGEGAFGVGVGACAFALESFGVVGVGSGGG